MRIRTANNNRRSSARRAFVRHWMTLRDNCEVCHGAKGGVRGNENRIGGLVACDYCHSDGSADAAVAARAADGGDGNALSAGGR
jgi:hypothetical protein